MAKEVNQIFPESFFSTLRQTRRQYWIKQNKYTKLLSTRLLAEVLQME